MRRRDAETAKRFGILEKIKSFERDLLNIDSIVYDKTADGVCFDLDGFYDNLPIAVVPKYAIDPKRSDYWKARSALLNSVNETAARYDLSRTADRVEDYGEHFYFVFSCGKSWNVCENSN